MFITPWTAMTREANSLESRTQEHIRKYLEEQRKKLNDFHEKLKSLATTAKKKFPVLVYQTPDKIKSSKVRIARRLFMFAFLA